MDDADTPIDALKERVRLFCAEREWDPFHGAKDLAIGVITEAAELLDHFRFLSDAEVESLMDTPERRNEVEAEVADVLIFLLRLAQKYDIDLTSVVEGKLAANAERYPVDTVRGSNRKAGRENA